MPRGDDREEACRDRDRAEKSRQVGPIAGTGWLPTDAFVPDLWFQITIGRPNHRFGRSLLFAHAGAAFVNSSKTQVTSTTFTASRLSRQRARNSPASPVLSSDSLQLLIVICLRQKL
jgi:hypothetical protein